MTNNTFFKLMKTVKFTQDSVLNAIHRLAATQADAEQERNRHYSATGELLDIQPIKNTDFVIFMSVDELGIGSPLVSLESKRKAEEAAQSFKALFPRCRLAIVPATDISLSGYFVRGGH